MKTLIFAVSLLLGVSLGHAATGTIIDHLKDGFDAVYKFDMNILVSHHKLVRVFKSKFDICLRKSSQDDPEKFVMHLENVQFPNTEMDESLSPTINLPVVYTVGNKGVDQIHPTEADTKRSVDLKSVIMHILLQNDTENLIHFQSKNNTLIGNCELSTKHMETEDQLGVELNVNHDECFGKFVIEKLREFGVIVTDFDNTSGYYFDKATGQVLRTFSEATVKVVNPISISVESKIHFDFNGYKKIQEVFDETQNTQMYEKPISPVCIDEVRNAFQSFRPNLEDE